MPTYSFPKETKYEFFCVYTLCSKLTDVICNTEVIASTGEQMCTKRNLSVNHTEVDVIEKAFSQGRGLFLKNIRNL